MMVTHVDSGNSQSRPFEKEPVLAIELHTAPSPMVIPTIRTIAADLAARADFDLDSIDDLRMAVDDACAMLVPMAAANATLSCTFTVWAERIVLAAEVEVDDSADPLPTGSFGWRVLESLADEVSGLVLPRASDKHGRVRITLAKGVLTVPRS
jgi:serine/threonine-protein kinase RsbW